MTTMRGAFHPALFARRPAAPRATAAQPRGGGGGGRGGVPGFDAAECAPPRADVPQDEDGRRPLPPALPDVRTPRLAAHRAQAVPCKGLRHAGDAAPGRGADRKPGRALRGARAVHENPRRWRPHAPATCSRTSYIGTSLPVISAIEVASRPFSPQRWIRWKYDRSVETLSANPW